MLFNAKYDCYLKKDLLYKLYSCIAYIWPYLVHFS